MDSISRIGDQLPAELNLDRDSLLAFKSAAMELTTLFKTGKKASKKGQF
jgi:hypothetical protein